MTGTKNQIYEPEEDSFLLEEAIKKFARGRVLDMGTGSGIQAIAAASKKEVSEVIACDVNPYVIEKLKLIIKEKKIEKIKPVNSDLFSKIKGKFDVIAFNPPYLPDDKSDENLALDGGKTGNELILRFLEDAKNYLNKNGFILLLFSNLSGEDTLDKIKKIGFNEELVSKKSLPFFEELYVYKSTLTDGKKEFAAGKRGIIYKEGNVCIKEKNPHATKDSLKNEADFLKILNKKNIGPKFISFDCISLKRNFVEGRRMDEYLKEENDAKKIKSVLLDVIEQCYKMDLLNIDKKELTNPYKDIIIDEKNKPFLIDFERCRKTENPKNVTQFLQYILRISVTLEKKHIVYDSKKIISLAKDYKRGFSKNSFKKIIDYLAHVSEK